ARLGWLARGAGGDARVGQCLRWLPGHATDARNVQEKRAEVGRQRSALTRCRGEQHERQSTCTVVPGRCRELHPRAERLVLTAVHNPWSMGLPAPLPSGNKLELFIGTFIGAITFSGSVIAFGKLSGRIRSAPVVFKGQHLVNLALGIAMIGFGIWFFLSPPNVYWFPFIVMTALAFLLGFLIIIPIGGADMPVVISMLNS